jgi:hypothetical protein
MGKVIHPTLFPNGCVWEGVEVRGIEGSIEAIMALVWRVKKITLKAPYTSGSVLTVTLTTTAPSEEAIVCGPWPFSVSADNGTIVGDSAVNHYLQGGGTVTYLPVQVEWGGGELLWSLNLDSGVDSITFQIGSTGLSATIGGAGANDTGYTQPISVTCDEFWSYGGTYDTATGAPL